MIDLTNFDWGWMDEPTNLYHIMLDGTHKHMGQYHKESIINEMLLDKSIYETFFEVENGDVVFDSTETNGWYFDEDTRMEYDNYDSVHEEGNYLFVESYSKGNFFSFELETEHFNPIFLSPTLLEINERWQLITGLCYEGVELEKEFDDYWGKGYYYHLS